jgi:hypothetical protein
MLPKTLVFSGGGTRCLVFLPALIELQKRGHLSRVKEIWGTSAGSLLGSLYALSYDAQKVYDAMYKADFTKFRDIDVTNIFNIMTTWGLDDGKSLVAMIEDLLEQVEPGSKTKTMSELPTMNIIVSDLTLRETVVVNATTFPKLRLVEAIRASMSFPFFLRPYITETKHIWIDGGLIHNFPWHLLPSDQARAEALGFAFLRKDDGAIQSLTQYIFAIINFNKRKHAYQLSNVILFPIPAYPLYYIKFNDEDYAMVENISMTTVTAWLSTYDLGRLPGTSEIPGQSAGQNTPSPTSPASHTIGSLGNQTPCREPVQGSSPPQSLYRPLSYRRWSV